MKAIDYELVCDISLLFGKKIFIYGTGVYGNKVASVFLQMEIEIDGFCETDPKSNVYLGKKVLSAETLIKDHDESNVLVIVASEKYFKEMIYKLQIADNMTFCTYYALFISIYLNYEKSCITETLKNKVKIFKKVSLETAIRNTLGWGIEHHCNILSEPSLVWVYQPGKVGSASIYRSSPLKTYHVHSLAYIFNTEGDMLDTCNDMVAQIKNNPIKIITGVREPISRDISLFFQGSDISIWPLIRCGNSWIYLFGDYFKNGNLDAQGLRKRICVFEKSLGYSFEHLCGQIIESRADEFSWFDYEIKALLGVDIYSYPFDKEKGYTIIEQDNIRILVYKCEKLDQLEKVVGDFLDEPDFSLIKANQGSEKVYSYVYKKFKEEIGLSERYFDYYYAGNPRLEHFYTDIEIEHFKDKWKNKIRFE